jgi:hypothetical protein
MEMLEDNTHENVENELESKGRSHLWLDVDKIAPKKVCVKTGWYLFAQTSG